MQRAAFFVLIPIRLCIAINDNLSYGLRETTEGNLSEERFSSNSFPKTFASFGRGQRGLRGVIKSVFCDVPRGSLPPPKRNESFREGLGDSFYSKRFASTGFAVRRINYRLRQYKKSMANRPQKSYINHTASQKPERP